jgi:hypothetical protein
MCTSSINVDPRHDVAAAVGDGSSFGPMAAVATPSSREISDENSVKDPQDLDQRKQCRFPQWNA